MFNPITASEKIVDEFREYLLTTFRTNKDYYNQQLAEELTRDVISSGPYISITDPYKKGHSLKQLYSDPEYGVSEKISGLVTKNPRLYPERPLYEHQERALTDILSGKNTIVCTGTGSGKTESFLIPIINELLLEKEKGTLTPGVRALIIYPMNALANDQIRRLRELLKDTPDITFGNYTGLTKDS